MQKNNCAEHKSVLESENRNVLEISDWKNMTTKVFKMI